YRAALPWGDGSRHLYALPGNHDWYDGLTSFLRVFCQKDWVGGWKTHQSRSYFALQLPHRWWLWGIDIQFDSYIDQPQLDYFDLVVGPMVQPGDSIILCSAKPTWVKSNRNRPEDYVNLDYFDRKIIRKRGAEARLFLTGDTHHYARYEQEDGGRQLVTAGGGGAYLSATHDLPERLELPPSQSRDPGKTRPPTYYRLAETFPSRETSRRLKRRVITLPFTNTGFWALMGLVHMLFGWMAAGALSGGGVAISERLSNRSIGGLLDAVAHSPIAVGAAIATVLALVSFTQEPSPRRRWVIGSLHGVVQLVMVVVTIRLAAVAMAGIDGIAYWLGYFAILAVPGGLLGSLVLALYLIVADHWSCNSNELFASQRIQDYKNFLRLHLAEDGTLTVYPVGVEKVCRRWKLATEGEPSDSWLEPVDAQPPFLIEPPVAIQPSRPA
ncbi:MAG: metallophosphoesterase, partial [Actinomycetota bacterium]|nr:metallophosphoesterase [Actinomycetota bacterium]